MTVRALKVKGEKVSFLAHADSAEKLVTGATTGSTPTGWNFKVKGTYLHWVDFTGAERRKEGTLTGNSRAFGNTKVKGETILYGDVDGDERYVSARVTVTYYPDAHPESTSVDGMVRHIADSSTWAQIRDGVGNNSDDDDDWEYLVRWQCDSQTDRYDHLHRSIFLFDTSAIPDGATILSAILSIYTFSTFRNDASWDIKANIYSSNPASNTALVGGDYDSLGTTPLCDTDIAFANIKGFLNPGYNNFTLNTTGLAAISKTAITKLGLREVTYDVGDTPPPWTANYIFYISGYLAEKGGDFRPKLVITYE